MQTWFIDDYAIPYLLRLHGFYCVRQNITSSFGNNWFVTDCPVPMDGEYTLPDGVIIEGCGGVELSIKNRQELITARSE